MNIEFSFETLRRLGLTPAMAQSLATADVANNTSIPLDATPPQWMRVAAVHRETVEVHDGTVQCSARCAARLTRELIDEGSALAVGDWVLCTLDEHQQLWVSTRVQPLNQIVRRDADGSRHTVVSNVDTALLVMGMDLDFNLQRLERYLALVGSSGVLPVVVLTKADIAEHAAPGSVQQRMQAVRGRVGQHVDVVAVDGRSADAQAALLPYLSAGQTLVLLGSSGAGKSTLTNSLLGSATQDTGAVREHDSRGKHTTTARSLHLLPTGACVIDTPGVRTLRPDVDGHTLGQLFEDISTLAHTCRFRDCRHQDEPGCAVRAQVSPERLKNYQKLLRESRRDTMGVLERQRQLAQWKARGRAGRQRLESKRAGPVS
ncbi:ribosome small subunit-dependent GTPase A [Rhodoferax sp. AJA081-3]|uniref:ribosome small subunit-dependent GTPase A n=1 Tax=Rhodoferax sp. AJA081-3 TaxID=2752316 RepID=UPI001AE0B16E|nr:ribosome small subunit-dependent GTPase A [Rhodoferax sp. AJA081-3]QTN30105.1 ribosome small subunit-dependent GTPase A [Rhodoferax sp. AJA081-3]